MYDMESKNLNSFCKNCQFKKVPKLLKDKYNKYVQKIFVDECPIFDGRVKGCTTKMFHQVEWEAFVLFLLEKNFLSQEEIKQFDGFVSSSKGDSQGIPAIP